MRSINNQFTTNDTEPRISVTDDNGTTVTFGRGGDYDRVYEVSVENNIDLDTYDVSMSFQNNDSLGNSLDPLDQNSDFNDGTIATDLLDKYHDVEIEITKDGGTNYYTIFEGYVGEISARRQVDGDDIIDFAPYGKDKPLKDVIVLESAPNQPYEYYSIDAFDCADEILSDNGFSLTLNRSASDDPQKAITEYKVKNTNVWDALKEIFAQTGYKLMFKPVAGSFDLVVIDPDRGETSSPVHSFNGGFNMREIQLNDRDVRTKVVVFYVNRESETRERFTVSDSTALANYGADNYGGENLHRTMVLKEEDKSLIDTEVEAKAYANAALTDLKAPTPDTQIEFPHTIPGIELYDVLEFGGVGDYTVQVGVTSVSYSFGVDDLTGTGTVSGTVDRVIGERDYWLNKGQLADDIDAQKGDRKAPSQPTNPPRLEKTTYVDETGTTRAKVVVYGETHSAFDVIGYKFRYRVCNTETGECEPWKYTERTEDPQTTITGLEVGRNLKLEVQYSAVDWENGTWEGVN